MPRDTPYTAAAFGASVVAFVNSWAIDTGSCARSSEPGAKRAIAPSADRTSDRQAAPLPTETTLPRKRGVSDIKVMVSESNRNIELK